MTSPKIQSYSGELLHFQEVILKKRGTEQEIVSQIKGESGTVLRSNKGKLHVNLPTFYTSPPCVKQVAVCDQRGRVLEESDYYRLSAVDNVGRAWTAEKVLVDEESVHFLGGRGNNATFEICSDFLCSNDVAVGDDAALASIKLLINEDVSFISHFDRPPKTNFQVGYNFSDTSRLSIVRTSLAEQHNQLSIWYQSSTLDKPVELANSLCEALQFVLGQRVSWFYLEKNVRNQTDFWLRPSSRHIDKSRLNPPILLDRIYPDREKTYYSRTTDVVICYESHFWLLFEKYLRYVFQDRADGFSHNFSGWMARLIESGNQSIEAQMLTVSVAVESIIKDSSSTFRDKKTASKKNTSKGDKIVDQITKIEEWLEDNKSDLDDAFLNRIKGFLNSIKGDEKPNSERAIDILHQLKDKNLIANKSVKTWKRVRNRAAHGSILSPDEVTGYIQKCDRVYLLFFQLIFLAIGYEGPFSNYAKDNWPTENFDKSLV